MNVADNTPKHIHILLFWLCKFFLKKFANINNNALDKFRRKQTLQNTETNCLFVTSLCALGKVMF